MARPNRQAPPLTLKGPLEPVAPGQPFPCIVSTALSHPLEVREVRVEVVGCFRHVAGEWGFGPVKFRTWSGDTVVHTRHFIPIKGTLGPGTASYRLEVLLPGDAPPSARGRIVEMRYTLRATLDIPRAPDKWAEMPLTVRAPLPTGSKPFSPTQLQEGVQVHLDAPVNIIAGQRVEGAITLGTSHPVVLDDLRLELVRWERVPHMQRGFTTRRVPFPPVSLGAYEKRQLSFTLLVPPEAPPTCLLPRGAAIFWTFQVCARKALVQQEVTVQI